MLTGISPGKSYFSVSFGRLSFCSASFLEYPSRDRVYKLWLLFYAMSMAAFSLVFATAATLRPALQLLTYTGLPGQVSGI